MRFWPALPPCFCLLATTIFAQNPDAKVVRAAHVMVTSVHHEATDAGVEILRQGGNAVDAAVAVGFALAVVYPQAGNIGGGGFMMIRPTTDHHPQKPMAKDGKPHFIDFREKAPAAATADMYLDKNRNIVKGMSTVGYKASGVPGTVAGLALAERKYGRLGLKAVMQPAIRLAREGYVLTDAECSYWGRNKTLASNAESRRIFQRNGHPYQGGDRFIQPELAKTLERIAADPSDFYKGKMAAQIAKGMQAGGGLITTTDLAAYEAKERTPLVGHYRGYEVLTAPPPSSGGIVMIEALNILSGYDLAKLGKDRSAAQVHIITEAFRRAYMDRNDYLGDPDFNHNPLKEMANPAYAAAWRKSIDPVNATPSAKLVRPAGFMPPPPKIPSAPESQQTTHFSVVDADGNAVSTTYTLNFTFGSGITIPGLGFLMNDEMDDFTSKIGAPNGFGLIQGPANAIGPGHRPLSCMSPTIVSKDGHLRLVLGSPGGSTIMTTVLNNLISVVDNGLNIQQSADAPRFHHQYLPDVLQLEKTFPRDVAEQLRKRGYTISQQTEFDEKSPGTWGDSELIEMDAKTGELMSGHDSRRTYGKAAGY
ncbi:MAG: gamma-glutamyltransferase [Acidobacteria bacterium]|nr:gamma-glutamyltransferase [Acidobacteriota bacterium]